MTFTGSAMSKLQKDITYDRRKNLQFGKNQSLVSQDQLFSFESNLTDIPSPKKTEIKIEVANEKGCQ